MKDNILIYIKQVLDNMPDDWLKLTTHRLDIYEEPLAKTQFLDQLEVLFRTNNAETSALSQLPTAYDYIRLGHPLSCLLEWVVAHLNNIEIEAVISFSSQTMPLLAILRKNLLDNRDTQIVYSAPLPQYLDLEALRHVYGYKFDIRKLDSVDEITAYDGSTVYLSQSNAINRSGLNANVDFLVNIYSSLGSILLVNGERNNNYISEIQHVRRRETIAMTPANCSLALQAFTGQSDIAHNDQIERNKTQVLNSIATITGTNAKALIGSSGLSIQYAIMMGLIDDALEKHPGKEIRIIVPPNCYGGTNDQARRVAACIKNVSVLDLPVDGDNDMVRSTNLVLEQVANEDAVPLVIAEIPTNPRVEVPDLVKLKESLSTSRNTKAGGPAVSPVFILDQTFCPNVHFLGEGEMLSSVKTISYVSGSKFPSGGKCTAGYCVANKKAEMLMEKVEKHLKLCDNEATNLQIEILAKQMPSMNQRIADAYKNTLEFVHFIEEVLPSAKINFVSEELAEQGFTPSVFSLDLPTKGQTDEEKETYKRNLNHQLIDMMINEIPNESKYCVSYGQLQGCYWTIPATSTQGTTKEGDKDYIARVALSPNMNLELHKKVFLDFVKSI